MAKTANRPPTRIGPKKPVKVFLKQWRKHFKLSQTKLGARIGDEGVEKGTVSRWETLDRLPDIDVLAAYAEALGIPIAYLYRPPASGPSLDDLAADLSETDRSHIIETIQHLRRRTG